MSKKLTSKDRRSKATCVIELVAKEIIFGSVEEDKTSIGNVLAYKLIMKSSMSGIIIELVENADAAEICDLLMKNLERVEEQS